MNDLIKRLTIDKDFVFVGQLDDLKQELEKSKDLNFDILTEKEMKFFPTISWGTMAITNGIGLVDGINVRALISESNHGRLKVNLKTSIRPEHYFIIVIFIFISMVTILTEESKWIVLLDLVLWIIVHWWFQFIYRFQENYLVDKVVDRLRLTKM